MRDVLPDEVVNAIKSHLRDRANRVEQQVWESSHEDEDALTGDFFGSLRTKDRTVRVNGRECRWSVTYKKPRGRGQNAPEKRVGADGIFEVEVEDVESRELDRKGLPFQAKKGWCHRDADLVEQVKKMEDVCEGASGVIDYSPDGFTALDGRAVLENAGRPPENRMSVGKYLGRVVECASGSRDVFYDASRGLLLVRSRAIRVPIKHRLRVSVEIE